jgi:hypothetical protein
VTPRVALALALALLAAACSSAPSGPKHRERDASRDRECKDATRPRAFFYPAENRTEYRPDDPHRDGCELLVADHLFCCPDATRSTDR